MKLPHHKADIAQEHGNLDFRPVFQFAECCVLTNETPDFPEGSKSTQAFKIGFVE